MKKLKNKGELAVVVVCAVVGFLLAAQLRSVKLNLSLIHISEPTRH